MTPPRKNYFRGIKVKLECGHTEVIATSFYLLNKNRVGAILGHHARRGVFCKECGTICMPAESLGTCRLEDDEVPDRLIPPSKKKHKVTVKLKHKDRKPPHIEEP